MSTRGFLDKLEPRERRLLGVLGAVVGAILVFFVPFLVVRAASQKASENQEVRDLIATLSESRGAVAERRAKHDALLARYARPAPKLAGFIDEIARANGIVAEAQDRPDNPHGKRYNERLTVVKMHKVGLRAVAKTLEKIEQSGHPVAITRLNIRPRSGEQDSYEVEAGVSAFDRKADPAAAAKPAASATAGPKGEPDEDEETSP